MQAVQRIKREKRMDGGKKKEEVDDPHTSAAKRKSLQVKNRIVKTVFLLQAACYHNVLLFYNR